MEHRQDNIFYCRAGRPHLPEVPLASCLQNAISSRNFQDAGRRTTGHQKVIFRRLRSHPYNPLLDRRRMPVTFDQTVVLGSAELDEGDDTMKSFCTTRRSTQRGWLWAVCLLILIGSTPAADPPVVPVNNQPPADSPQAKPGLPPTAPSPIVSDILRLRKQFGDPLKGTLLEDPVAAPKKKRRSISICRSRD